MTPNVKRASRKRVEQIAKDASRAAIELPPPAKFYDSWREREARAELRRRGEDI